MHCRCWKIRSGLASLSYLSTIIIPQSQPRNWPCVITLSVAGPKLQRQRISTSIMPLARTVSKPSGLLMLLHSAIAILRKRTTLWSAAQLRRFTSRSSSAALPRYTMLRVTVPLSPGPPNSSGQPFADDADRAMEWLEAAAHAGFNDRRHMVTDDELETIRGRRDFQRLLRSITGESIQSPREAGQLMSPERRASNSPRENAPVPREASQSSNKLP